jgi:glucose-1-phosphatase
MNQRTLIFDIGNVLVTFDFARASRIVAANSDCDADAVLRTISSIKDELESGRVDEKTFFQEAMSLVGFRGSLEHFEAAWCDIFEENEEMKRTLASLPGDVRLLLLSNTNEPHKRWLFKTYDLFTPFEGGVFSHEAKCMKPEDDIYRQLIEGFDLAPAECFYIDDLAANIEAGKRHGLHCYQYNPAHHAGLVSALESWLVKSATAAN